MEQIETRPVQQADRDAVRRVAAAAFGDEGPVIAELIDLLHATGRVEHELVAEPGGAVVGHVLLSRGWVDAPERLAPVLVLGPLSVDPTAQRAGVGSALVHAALAQAQAAGEAAVFLEGDPGYYGRLGFEPAGEAGFERPSTRIPEPAFQVVTLAAFEPWMSGRLVYCDAFWELDCVGLRGEHLADVEAALGIGSPTDG
ncbi:GNAT family N-acetyltransferase [Nocardioides sp. Soil796]|uniref:GNAT family N-acetyltransferase n=1 Tax=Nocardioides sp. Soil796 TaxID=1736412 RepID=UPI000A87B76A|nr:N-acetyltransferase [Nocardioides sp. Soil796]